MSSSCSEGAKNELGFPLKPGCKSLIDYSLQELATGLQQVLATKSLITVLQYLYCHLDFSGCLLIPNPFFSIFFVFSSLAEFPGGKVPASPCLPACCKHPGCAADSFVLTTVPGRK